MTPRDLGVALAKRLAVTAVVAVLIVAVAFAIPAATNSSTESEPLDTPEYDAEALATTPIPAEGEIEANRSAGNRAGVVVIDESHSNRFDRSDLDPLVQELTSIGYGVRFYDGSQTLDQELSNANAFLVIDPAQEFARDDIDDIREFTEEGGHLLIVGEPSRKRVSASLFGTSISEQESALTTLTARYDMSLGTSYLYNLGTNGGNYKHVVARSTGNSDLDLDQVVMFTAAPVYSRTGTVLLRTTRNTHEAGIDGTSRHAVAIHKEGDNVVLLGDSSFLRADRFNVGDNERFAAFLVEFLVSGERVVSVSDDEENETDDGTGVVTTDVPTPTDTNGDDGSGTNNTTATPAPQTPAADRLDPATTATAVAAGPTTMTIGDAAPRPTMARAVDPFEPSLLD
jgi:hypothetical protein